MKLLVTLMAASLSFGAYAQDAAPSSDASSTLNVSDVAPNVPKKDIDDEISNAKLRAQSGAKSKWSTQTNLIYSGGSVNEPFAPLRPNYAGIGDANLSSNVVGNVVVAYRFNEHDALRGGIGLYMNTPFQGSPDTMTNTVNPNGHRETDIANPYLDYSHTARIAKTQNIFDANLTYYTQSFYSNQENNGGIAQVATLDVNHTIVYEFPKTALSLGVNLDGNYTTYSDQANRLDNLNDPVNGRVDLEFGFYPYVEYGVSDKLSLRTVFRSLTFDHYRTDAQSTYYQEMYTQSVGLGWALKRDIYLYPNVQFAPSNLAADQTNVGMQATINL